MVHVLTVVVDDITIVTVNVIMVIIVNVTVIVSGFVSSNWITLS